MHFHLPKPLHGWREFAGEVGIIVVGVLIALGAEQIVERWRWDQEVNEAQDDLRTELEGNLFNAQERVRLEPCIDRRLDQINEMIDHPPAEPWKMLPCRNVAPIRVWSTSGWESAVADGAVAHMSRERRSQYANVYSFVRGLHAMVLEEFPVNVEFRMLEHGGPLEPDVLRRTGSAPMSRGCEATITCLPWREATLEDIQALGVQVRAGLRRSRQPHLRVAHRHDAWRHKG